ncbi:MAG TPA: flagellar motor switch protein FliM [Gammaproteobacteria bacterium]|nr:flagellar motor switch protein FliM [Gammaproteobacteria bacterium]
MASTRKLSSDEVNALIEGLSEDGGENTVTSNEDKDVRPFQFGSDDLSLLGDYYALRMINERFARMARQVFLPMLRIQPRISSFPPEVKTFDEYTAGIENFMSLNISRIEELRGSMLVVLSPTFISVLTNSYYGGKIKPLATTRSEFTATEERIIEIISSGLNETLEVAWRDLLEISIQYSSREVNPQFASFVDGSDLVIICSFVVQLPDIDAASFDVIYPLQTLKPIASLLRSRVQTDKANDDKTWRDRMERAVVEIPLNLTARLSEPTVSMNKLIHLKEGDVFPIEIGEGVEILIEKLPFYNGELGEVGGQAAISLTDRRSE